MLNSHCCETLQNLNRHRICHRGDRLCNRKLKGAKVPKIGAGRDRGEGWPSWRGLGAAGVQRHAPLSHASALQTQMCFSVRLDGTLERTDDYLSGWVGVAQGFKKYPVWSCGKACIPVKNKTTLSISSQRRVLGTRAVHLICSWHVWGGAEHGGFFCHAH